MKRLIHSLLAAAVLVSAMTCTAFAVETEEEFIPADGSVVRTDEVDGDGEFTATYGSATKEKQYVVMVIKCEEGEDYKQNLINDPSNNLLYINQLKAEGSVIEFDILPSSVENSVVVLGGENEPQVLGHIYKPEPAYVLGNVNNDLKDDGITPLIDIEDALLILRYDVELVELDETQMLAANVNHDYKDSDEDSGVVPNVDIEDALRILRYDVELISYEEMIAPAN